MKIFAIADLHLAFSVDKPMHIFGEHWIDHPQKIAAAWRELVSEDDLVLIPGDVSWAMRLNEAELDFGFIDELPGRKVVIRGNHDYWWASLKKMRESLPGSILPLQNTSFVAGNVGIAGSRLWIDPDLNLESGSEDDAKIFKRELARLRMSLDSLPGDIEHKIIMTHYPPLALNGDSGLAVELGREYGCDLWIFGHMHLSDIAPDYSAFNREIDGTRYEFVSADYLGFVPKLIFEV